MVTADARNYRRLNVIFPCQAEGIPHRHARQLSLYPPMPYSQASNYSITDGLTKTMFLIGNSLVVTCWKNFIHCRGATASAGGGTRAQGKQCVHENYKAGRGRE